MGWVRDNRDVPPVAGGSQSLQSCISTWTPRCLRLPTCREFEGSVLISVCVVRQCSPPGWKKNSVPFELINTAQLGAQFVVWILQAERQTRALACVKGTVVPSCSYIKIDSTHL